MQKNGRISVESENIFPIIRQWLYSEEEIFIRELVANAMDAQSKRAQLIRLGEAEAADEPMTVRVRLDETKGTLTIADQGLGMTAEEMDKYINRIAYSGLLDFVDQIKEEGRSDAGIIGHFGLGFYSAFMVAEPVQLDSLSYQAGAKPAFWESAEGLDFEMREGSREETGTTVRLFLTEEAKKAYTPSRLKELLKRFCGFMAYPIVFEHFKDGALQGEAERINETDPLWNQDPQNISDEDYIAFYREQFNPLEDPMFWIHLNLDYPFRVRGILYFPKKTESFQGYDDRIRVYSRQVFVADDVREIIPEFLFLLQGSLDCPDLPLNVSRSYLQDDGYVQSLRKHIVRKVADRLISLYEEEPERYREVYPDLSLFFKIGLQQSERFYDKLHAQLLLKKYDGSYVAYGDLTDEVLYYSDQAGSYPAYIAMLRAKEKTVLLLDEEYDERLISFLEYKKQGKQRFMRVDAELLAETVEAKTQQEAYQKFFAKLTGQKDLSLSLKALGAEAPAILFLEEETGRRFRAMQAGMQHAAAEEQAKMDELAAMFPVSTSLVVNDDSPLPGKLLSLQDAEKAERLGQYLLAMAELAQGKLKGERLIAFMHESQRLLEEALD